MIPRDKLERIYAIIDRISDKEFQGSVWGGADINAYPTYVISCLEAIEMLEDENYYSIVESHWDKTGLSKDLQKISQDFVQKINDFNGDELPYEDLALAEDWIKIMDLAKIIKEKMAIELKIDPENPPTW